MKKCIAYRSVAGAPNAWVRCVRTVQRGTYFCPRHSEALSGAVLGMHMAGMLDEYEGWQHRKSKTEPAKTSTEKVM